MSNKKFILIIWLVSACVFHITCANSLCQENSKPADRIAYVDGSGVMRWKDTNDEIALFGVNYCLPSAYSYRAIGYVGADHKKTIDADVSHFARMGLDGVRLSFWGDWENSDRQGNLIDNEHLELLDYVIYKAKMRGIYMLLTPIVLYSPVWPEPEELNKNQGFPKFYTKAEMGTNPDAVKAQQNYLSQVMNHVNRYTSAAYKDEPAILCVELINEPYHHPDKDPVGYINALVKAVRDTGCKKPLFHNVSQNMKIASAIRDSNADGASFAWYPTGLVNGRSLQSNFLPRIDDYQEMRISALERKAKIVYEFDAPDVAGSFMYPAMARTFRVGGIQFAAMFTYDPLAIASRNLEFQTHYLNLAYSPHKAASFIIAARAFHLLPRLKSYGKYPENTNFGPFRVSYEQDLSEMITQSEFLYSNDTRTKPPNPALLERIIGCGSSPVIEYDGTGLYFLEKMKPGAWRLEVYPDAVWVNDPFGKPSRDREVSRLIWRKREMKINLPDLGSVFSVSPIDKGNTCMSTAKAGEFTVSPGVYILNRADLNAPQLDASLSFGQVSLGEFMVPSSQKMPVVVSHEAPREIVEGRPFTVKARVVSDSEANKVILYVRSAGGKYFSAFPMQSNKSYEYVADIPREKIKSGILEYAISVLTAEGVRTFPSNSAHEPNDLGEVTSEAVIIYDAKVGNVQPKMQNWFCKDPSAELVEANDGVSALRVTTSGFGQNGSVAVDVPVQPNIKHDSDGKSYYCEAIVTVRARALSEHTTKINMTLVDKFSTSYPVEIPLGLTWSEHKFHIRDICVANLDSIRLNFGAWLFPEHGDARHGFEIERITAQPSPNLWQVPVVSQDSAVALFNADRDEEVLFFPNSEHGLKFRKSFVPGITLGRKALRIDVPDFKAYPQDVSFRVVLGSEIDNRRADPDSFDILRLQVRAGQEQTRNLALALIEQNGAVWGTNVELTTKWQQIEIPLSKLRPMVVTYLPRPYPTIFNYWDQGSETSTNKLNIKQLEACQISFGARLLPTHTADAHSIEVQCLMLDKSNKSISQ